MQVIKMIQSGWEGYTGPMFGVSFVEGVSTAPVDARTATRIASILLVETLDGVNPSASQQILDAKNVGAEVVASRDAPPGEVSPQASAPTGAALSREALEALADTSGIASLRAVGDRLGVKAHSISQLIEKILAAQPSAVVKDSEDAGAE